MIIAGAGAVGGDVAEEDVAADDDDAEDVFRTTAEEDGCCCCCCCCCDGMGCMVIVFENGSFGSPLLLSIRTLRR